MTWQIFAACAAGFFWIFALHILTGFLDFMTNGGVGSRSGLVAHIDNAINAALVIPLGSVPAAGVLFVAGVGAALLVGRTQRQRLDGGLRKQETENLVVSPYLPTLTGEASFETSTSGPKIWMSSILSAYEIGNKPGLRVKFFDADWPPARHELDAPSEEEWANLRRYIQGYALAREKLPEAVAVFDEKCFQHMRDVFFAGGFVIVRGNLVEALSRFDLGAGGLVPISFYKADLITAYGGDFFVLNFGARKNSILPEHSQNVVKFAVDHKTGIQHWKVNSWSEDGDVALSPIALDGPDLWVEEVVDNKIFMNGALAQALIEIGMGDVFKLKECQIVFVPD